MGGTGRPDKARVALLIVAVSLLGGCGAQLMPTPNIYRRHGAQAAFDQTPTAWRSSTIDLLYVTDRESVDLTTGAVQYGHDRSAALAFGSAVVEIGNDLSWAELVEQSCRGWRSRSLTLRLKAVTELARFHETPLPIVGEGDDWQIDPAALAQEKVLAERFFEELRQRLALTDRKDVFVLVHGNFAQFSDAVFMTAGLWHYLGRQGVAIAYSWPSGSKGGLLRRYTRDSESGEFTVFHLKQFLRGLAHCDEVRQVHLIAHSKGTDVVATALRELFLETRGGGGDPKTEFKIGHLVLAAPDMDLGVAIQRISAEHVFAGVEDVTIYVSPMDMAIGAAQWLFRSQRRVGMLRPEDIEPDVRRSAERTRRTDVVEAQVRGGEAGHYYFLEDPAASSDLILLLRDDYDAGAVGERPLKSVAPGFWLLRDGYPPN